jgi:hypothetical protein
MAIATPIQKHDRMNSSTEPKLSNVAPQNFVNKAGKNDGLTLV